MTRLTLTSSASGTVLALLPQAPAQAAIELGHAVAATLAMLAPDLRDDGTGTDCGHVLSPSYAADIEYASWMPDPAALEVASWTTHISARPPSN